MSEGGSLTNSESEILKPEDEATPAAIDRGIRSADEGRVADLSKKFASG